MGGVGLVQAVGPVNAVKLVQAVRPVGLRVGVDRMAAGMRMALRMALRVALRVAGRMATGVVLLGASFGGQAEQADAADHTVDQMMFHTPESSPSKMTGNGVFA